MAILKIGMQLALVVGLTVCAGAAAAYDEAEVVGGGSIQGTVIFEGAVPELQLMVNADREVCLHEGGKVASPRLQVGPEGGVANAVVYLKDIDQGKSLESLDAPMALDQEGCLYKPFVQVMPRKGVLTLINSDPLNHNVHARQEGHRDPFNYAMPNASWPEKQTIQKRMVRPGIVSVKCDVHMWMSAYVLVVKHPYYTVTDAQGNFELTEIPEGNYELALWHPGWQAKVERNPQGQISGYAYSEPVEQTRSVEVTPGETTTLQFQLTAGSAGPSPH